MMNIQKAQRVAINSVLEPLMRELISDDDNQNEAGFLLTESTARPIYVPGSKADLSSDIQRRMLIDGDFVECTHFIPMEHAVACVANRQVYLKPMSLQSDVLEYEHAFAEAFSIWPLQLLPQQVNGEWNTARAAGRDNYIFCLTRREAADTNQEMFWKEYGRDGTGVRLDLKISPALNQDFASLLSPSRIPSVPGYTLSVGRIVYDNGVLFDGYKELRTVLLKMGIETTPTGFANIALRYKRERFSWEDEVRITLDTVSDASLLRAGDYAGYMALSQQNRERAMAGGFLTFYPSIGEDVNGVYLNMDNRWFKMEINSVEAGPSADAQVVRDLEQACRRQGISFTHALPNRSG